MKKIPACAGMTGLRCSRANGSLAYVILMRLETELTSLLCRWKLNSHQCHADASRTHVIPMKMGTYAVNRRYTQRRFPPAREWRACVVLVQMEVELTSFPCRCEPNPRHSHADGNLCCKSALYLNKIHACAGMTGLRCSRVDGCLTYVIPVQMGI